MAAPRERMSCANSRATRWKSRMAELRHPPGALHAQLRLERAGAIVDARMQHAAVVSGLVLSQLAFLLQQRQTQLGPAVEQLVGECNPDNPTADYRHIVVLPDYFHDEARFIAQLYGEPRVANAANWNLQ